MPIERLPQGTIHTLASSQVLTDSRSVVKELVDNSLDAQASAIFIEISLNAIDVIQVRDNGHGIFPDDRLLVGKKHCTSKIRSLDDLETIGGLSLGFRGEALSSAAEMSGSMVVSTRIEGEVTAVSLTIGRKGDIEKEERTSLAVGTTVRILDFLKAIPVRRQTAVKSSTKHLAYIKSLLQAYALARPSVRFSMKILKAKGQKGDWIYAPKIGDGIPDAVIKVVGNKVAEHCRWKTWSSSLRDSLGVESSNTKTKVEVNECYTIEAFLPVPKCDLKIVNNVSQFVSIDFRPVSSNRGTPKQIINLYKSYLTSGALTENNGIHRDPFLCMNIICPTGSYDINIEPAKDDVLFTDANFIKAVEAFFKSVYGELRVRALESVNSKSTGSRPRGFDILLAKKPSLIPALIPQLNNIESSKQDNGQLPNPSKLAKVVLDSSLNTEPNKISWGTKSGYATSSDLVPQPSSSISHCVDVNNEGAQRQLLYRPTQIWQSNMYADSREDPDFPINPQTGDCQSEDSPTSEGEDDSRNAKALNPWVFAKINAPFHRRIIKGELHPDVESNDQLHTPGKKVGEITNMMSREVDDIFLKPNQSIPYLPTPQCKETRHATTPSRSSPDSFPQRAWRKTDHREASKQLGTPEGSSSGFGNLDTWIQAPSKSLSITPYTSSQASGDEPNSEPLTHRNGLDFMSARNLDISSPPSVVPGVAPRRPRKPPLWKQQMGNLNKPFTSPVVDLAQASSRTMSKTKDLQPQRGGAHGFRDTIASLRPHAEDLELVSESDISASKMSVHPDLARTMDYELRKKEAIQNWKASKHQREAREQDRKTPSKKTDHSKAASPHQNRYNKAIAALHPMEADERSSSATTLDPSDPRAYLIRAQQREESAAPGESPSRLRKRRKTSRLPFESLREDSILRDLTLGINSEHLNLKTCIAALIAEGTCTDRYVATGTLEAKGFTFPPPAIECIRSWEAKLRELVKKLYAKNNDDDDDDNGSGRGGADILIDLWPVLQPHLTAAFP